MKLPLARKIRWLYFVASVVALLIYAFVARYIVVSAVKPRRESEPTTTVPQIQRDFLSGTQTPQALEAEKLKDRDVPVTVAEETDRCDLWKVVPDWSKANKPHFQSDGSRFLYPGLLYGPNNQLVQLYKAVVAAIHLNRTLVIPNFHTHYTFGYHVIPPHQRLIVERICRLVSCVSLRSFRETCNGKFGVVFKGDVKLHHNNHKYMMSDCEMTIDEGSDEIVGAKHLLPGQLKATFNSTEPCALFYGLYQAVRLVGYETPDTELPADVLDPSKLDEAIVNRAAVDAVDNLPLPVMAVAAEYTREAFDGEEFVAVHWRYNKDWNLHCRNDWPMCKHINNITAAHVGRAVHRDLKKFASKFKRHINIYIATPPSIAAFGLEVLSQLKELDPRFRGPKMALEPFTNGRFAKCMRKSGWVYDDAMSLVEMAVVVQSEYFYYSKNTSWSGNCRYPRWVRPHDGAPRVMKYEANVFQLAEAVLLEENSTMVEAQAVAQT